MVLVGRISIQVDIDRLGAYREGVERGFVRKASIKGKVHVIKLNHRRATESLCSTLICQRSCRLQRGSPGAFEEIIFLDPATSSVYPLYSPQSAAVTAYEHRQGANS